MDGCQVKVYPTPNNYCTEPLLKTGCCKYKIDNRICFLSHPQSCKIHCLAAFVYEHYQKWTKKEFVFHLDICHG